MEELIEDYYIPMLLPVTENPKDYELSGEEFNPEVHLQLEPPLVVKDLNFNNISYPYDEKESVVHGNLAYTTSFRVLSDEGVAAARRAINMNQQLAKSNPRATKYLRGLGYCSKFHRGLAYNEELLSLLSSIARDKVGPQSMTMNISHTNIGKF